MRPFLIVMLTACNFFTNVDLCRAEVRLLVEDAISRAHSEDGGHILVCGNIPAVSKVPTTLVIEDLP